MHHLQKIAKWEGYNKKYRGHRIYFEFMPFDTDMGFYFVIIPPNHGPYPFGNSAWTAESVEEAKQMIDIKLGRKS